MRIFAGVPLGGDVKRQWGCWTAIFSVFAGYFFGIFRYKATIIIIIMAIRRSSSAFHWSQNAWPWMTLNDYFSLNTVFAPVFLAAETATFENKCVKTNKHRPAVSTTQILNRDSSFWQYKVYPDIGRDSLERRHQTTVGSRVNARAAVARILAYLKFIRCLRNKSAGSSDVGFRRDGCRCRSLRRQKIS